MDSNRISRKQYMLKRKRRRRALMLRALAVLAVIVIFAGIVTGAVLLLKGRTISGVFTRPVDVSDRICGDIALFLSDIEDIDIDSEWVKSKVGSYTVTEEILLSDTDKNSYSRSITSDSYDALKAKVNSDINTLLTEIIKDKLVEKGYKDDLSIDEANALINQILGMSASDYLSQNGISLVPELTDLSASVFNDADGEKGTFNVKSVIKKKGTLVFLESGRVYNEAQQ